MTSYRVRDCIKQFDKELTNCENIIQAANSVQKRIPNASGNPNKAIVRKVSRNPVVDRQFKPFITEPFPTGCTSIGKVPVFNSDGIIVHKEVLENNDATVEVTVKTKSKNNLKSRSLTKSSKPTIQKLCDDPITQVGMKQVNSKKQECKLHRKTYHTRVRSRGPSWGAILETQSSKIKDHNDFQNVRGKEISDISICNTETTSKLNSSVTNHKLIPHQKLKSKSEYYRSTDDAYSSESSSTESMIISEKLPKYANCSIQCAFPAVVPEQVESATTISSKFHKNYNEAFVAFNPVRTLSFLVRELKGKINKEPNCEGNINHIINNIEQVIQRIPAEQKVEFVSQLDTHRTAKNNTQSKYNADESLDLHPVKLPSNHSKIIPMVSDDRKNVEDVPDSKVKFGTRPVAEDAKIYFQKQMEASCSKLEVACRQMELTCNTLKEERDTLKQELVKKIEVIENAFQKEKEYLTSICSLKNSMEVLNLQVNNSTTKVGELEDKLSKETKKVETVEEQLEFMNKTLMDKQSDIERLHIESQILKMEREKHILLLTSKDEELDKLRKEVSVIHKLVSEQINGLKEMKVPNHMENVAQVMTDLASSSDSLESSPSCKPRVQKTSDSEKALICSSPTSSLSSSMGIYPSWKQISEIHADGDKTFDSKADDSGFIPLNDTMETQNAPNDLLNLQNNQLEDFNKNFNLRMKNCISEFLNEMRQKSLFETTNAMELFQDRPKGLSQISSVSTDTVPRYKCQNDFEKERNSSRGKNNLQE